MNPPQLVIIGGPSLDHISIDQESTSIVGGAGYLTALSARATGVSVGLVCRVPRTLPELVAAGFAPGRLDAGGLVPTDGSLPSFSIRYDEQFVAEYEAVESGVEHATCASDVPRHWLGAQHVHISPLGGSVGRLVEVAERLRARGFGGTISAGTFPKAVEEERAAVLRLFETVDLAFMNRGEFDLLYPDGAPIYTELVVTDGSSSVRHWRNQTWRTEPTRAAEVVVDPTGAGDAFCGGFVAARIAGDNEIATAQSIATIALQGLGDSSLLAAIPTERPAAPAAPFAADGVVAVDAARIREVGSLLASEASGSALDFCGFPFPERDDPNAMASLALATLHQFGFWSEDDHGYVAPMWAVADGKRFKGSDFVWQAVARAVAADSSVLAPERLAAEPLLFDRICVADDGECPIPAAGAHRGLQQGYGAAMGEIEGGIAALVERANQSERPAATLLESLSSIPGYAEDPLAKKAILLVLILANRPEGFLDLRDPESLGPIVDYHLMRGCLRTGCVTISDPDLRRRMVERAWISAAEETAVRDACFEALGELCSASGLTVAQIDGFFFVNGRKRCLETEDAKCAECPLESGCAQATDLFQPIFRTTAY